MLILCLGHPDRADDAAGPLAARWLRELGLEALEFSGDGLALLEAWSGAEQVVVIDAVSTGAPSGTISMWDGRTAPVLRGAPATHSFGLAEAIELGRLLGRLPPSLTIYGIEGRDFTPGRAPSAAVLAAVETLARRIAEEH